MSNVNITQLFTQAAQEVNGKKLEGLTKDQYKLVRAVL